MYIRKSFQNQKSAEHQVRQTLKQKENLLQELQHRTNNNLSMIISLLEMQAAAMGNKVLKEAFSRVENRIRALSLVHNQLVRSPDLSHINLGKYTGELVAYLLGNRSSKAAPIILSTQLEDVEVLIDSALPCGLILGEAVTNALTHGLTEDRGGILTLKVYKNSHQEVILEISDDGPGLPPNLDPRDVPTMGLSLIFLLAEQQLRGRVEYSRGPGFSLRVTFRDDQYQSRI